MFCPEIGPSVGIGIQYYVIMIKNLKKERRTWWVWTAWETVSAFPTKSNIRPTPLSSCPVGVVVIAVMVREIDLLPRSRACSTQTKPINKHEYMLSVHSL